MKQIIYFLGIPLVQIKKGINKNKYYILGIHLFNLKKGKGFLDGIFSYKISKNLVFLELKILGISVNFRRKKPFVLTKVQYNETVENFLHEIRKNSILIIEPNFCHFEVVPGFVKYLYDLEFKVDIITIDSIQLSYLENCLENVKVYQFNLEEINYILQSGLINEYKYLLFTSECKYIMNVPVDGNYQPLITDFFSNINFDKNRIIFVQHHMERRIKCRKVISLADFHNKYSARFKMVNPHYFGNIKITPRTLNTVNFITVGGMAIFRKNMSLLIAAVKELKQKGYNNFKIIVIGGGVIPELTSDIKVFFDIKGRLNNQEMFNCMEHSDFYLSLLDTEIKAHERYISIGTSGSFQLIYGFVKPCILSRKFAEKHMLNDENSIIYEQNNLFQGMKTALDMSSQEYLVMQKKLKITTENIYQQSLLNMKSLLEDK